MGHVDINSRTFRSGNSEAVRLPKGLGFGIDTPITIRREGDEIVIRRRIDPAAEKERLKDFVARMRALPAPSEIEVRDTSEVPERSGF